MHEPPSCPHYGWSHPDPAFKYPVSTHQPSYLPTFFSRTHVHGCVQIPPDLSSKYGGPPSCPLYGWSRPDRTSKNAVTTHHVHFMVASAQTSKYAWTNRHAHITVGPSQTLTSKYAGTTIVPALWLVPSRPPPLNIQKAPIMASLWLSLSILS